MALANREMDGRRVVVFATNEARTAAPEFCCPIEIAVAGGDQHIPDVIVFQIGWPEQSTPAECLISGTTAPNSANVQASWLV